MQSESNLPTYTVSESAQESAKLHLHILTAAEAELVPESHRQNFSDDGTTIIHEVGRETHYVRADKWAKVTINKDAWVTFSQGVSQLENYLGIASDILTIHKFSRKQKKPTPVQVHLSQTTPNAELILNLVRSRNLSKELANGRGDIEGTPEFFEGIAREFATKHGLEITVLKGDELKKDNFGLLHSVGRASINPPVFVNIKYQGNSQSDKWVAFVGKGVCFDTGGLDIKTAAGMKDMFLDKCGAVSVLTAFQAIVEEKVPINVTVSIGLVENSVSGNSYRPSDILTSRKGLTVEIGNTDAEGRLVLADCMHWTQEHYKTEVLIELSTLTGNIIAALGHRYAGLFTNDDSLKNSLQTAGRQVNEESWHMPLVDVHRELVRPKIADLTNHSGKLECGASQAAAFLEAFVEKDVKWIHLDVAGTAMIASEGTGYGTRLLLQYARNYVNGQN